MCFLGGERGIDDPSWPSNLCCRIYELPDFQGSNMTCCTSVREQRTVRDIELFGWNNEMSSWKCGKKVSAHFCFDKAQNCEWSDSESGAGWSYNPRVGVNDSMSSLILSHYNPKKELKATLFKEPNCQGYSYLLEADDNLGHSFTKYQDSYADFIAEGKFASVLLPKGTDFKLFYDGKFMSDSYNLREFTDNYECRNFHEFPIGKNEEVGDYGFRAFYFGKMFSPSLPKSSFNFIQ